MLAPSLVQVEATLCYWMRSLKSCTSTATRSACSCILATLSLRVHTQRKDIWASTTLTSPFQLVTTITSNVCFPGFSYKGRANGYQTSSWSLGEEYIEEYNKWFVELQTQFLLGRYYTRAHWQKGYRYTCSNFDKVKQLILCVGLGCGLNLLIITFKFLTTASNCFLSFLSGMTSVAFWNS